MNYVKFEPSNDIGKKLDEFRARTDEQGRFSIRILKGLKGNLYGEDTLYKHNLEGCSHIIKVIEADANKNGWKEVKTEILKIEAEKNLYSIELKFPFNSCSKSNK